MPINPEQLALRLGMALPGAEAQYRMAHAVRRQATPPPPDAREAAVLALLYPKNEAWHLVLIQRPNNNPHDRHGGQVSFPGGKREASDASLAHTALREAEEETGIVSSHVQMLGALTELYIPVSNFLVQPYVGLLDYAPVFQPQQEEVDAILEIPVEHFLRPDYRRIKDIEVGAGLMLHSVPYYHVADRVVWGATAMIISELTATIVELK